MGREKEVYLEPDVVVTSVILVLKEAEAGGSPQLQVSPDFILSSEPARGT